MSVFTGRLGFFFEQTIMFQLKNGLSIHLLPTTLMECLNSAKIVQRCDLRPALECLVAQMMASEPPNPPFQQQGALPHACSARSS